MTILQTTQFCKWHNFTSHLWEERFIIQPNWEYMRAKSPELTAHQPCEPQVWFQKIWWASIHPRNYSDVPWINHSIRRVMHINTCINQANQFHILVISDWERWKKIREDSRHLYKFITFGLLMFKVITKKKCRRLRHKDG